MTQDCDNDILRRYRGYIYKARDWGRPERASCAAGERAKELQTQRFFVRLRMGLTREGVVYTVEAALDRCDLLLRPPGWYLAQVTVKPPEPEEAPDAT